MATYLAGIDIGTTGSKGMIFDMKGNSMASAYIEYLCTYPKSGWVEQDPDLLVASAFDAMKQAVAKSGINSTEIVSVSLSAQRCCGIFLDADENLLRPMISWQDNRTPLEVDEIAQKIDPASYYKITGYPNSTTWLLSKMMWVRNNELEIWNKTSRVVQMHDYFLRARGLRNIMWTIMMPDTLESLTIPRVPGIRDCLRCLIFPSLSFPSLKNRGLL